MAASEVFRTIVFLLGCGHSPTLVVMYARQPKLCRSRTRCADDSRLTCETCVESIPAPRLPCDTISTVMKGAFGMQGS